MVPDRTLVSSRYNHHRFLKFCRNFIVRRFLHKEKRKDSAGGVTYMPRKIVIVGGVGGGATVAAQIRRNDKSSEIIIFDKGVIFLTQIAVSPIILAMWFKIERISCILLRNSRKNTMYPCIRIQKLFRFHAQIKPCTIGKVNKCRRKPSTN